MKKFSLLTSSTLLMMLALSPLARAGTYHGVSRSHSSNYRPSYVKPTSYSSYKPTYHKPSYHKPSYTYSYAKPTYHKPTYHAPSYHAPKYSYSYSKPYSYAPKYVTGYAKSYGVKFSHGYYYSGWNHKHWSKRVWYPKYGTWCWYCPSTAAWYYWYAPKACYYPMSYISTCTPAATTPEDAVVPPGSEQLPEVPTSEVEGVTE
jgi:hypothetical protein